jgi:hypothetical protein
MGNDDSDIAGGADRGGRTERSGGRRRSRTGSRGAAGPAAVAWTKAQQLEGNEALVGEQDRQIEDDPPAAAITAADHHAKRVTMPPAAFQETEIDLAGVAQNFAAVEPIEPKGCQRIDATRAAR